MKRLKRDIYEPPYAEQELFDIWRGFKSEVNALKMLADFACIPKGQAALLNQRFWVRFNSTFKPKRVKYIKAAVDPKDWQW